MHLSYLRIKFLKPSSKKSAIWLDSQAFKTAFTSSLSLKCFPPRLCLKYRKRWKSLGARSGQYGAWSKTSQPKDSINSQVIQKVGGLALSWRSKAPFDSMPRRLFAMLFGASVELCGRHLS
ncbi:hypothetical protein TNCV_4053831 [Trichonephila clavipes]|nr:hypothetical protein TNCV_4053831 [Trichonephila clavipes]